MRNILHASLFVPCVLMLYLQRVLSHGWRYPAVLILWTACLLLSLWSLSISPLPPLPDERGRHGGRRSTLIGVVMLLAALVLDAVIPQNDLHYYLPFLCIFGNWISWIGSNEGMVWNDEQLMWRSCYRGEVHTLRWTEVSRCAATPRRSLQYVLLRPGKEPSEVYVSKAVRDFYKARRGA